MNQNNTYSKLQVISLNIWGGRLREGLLQFIKSHQDIDIFCFQELYSNALEAISKYDKGADLDIFFAIQSLLSQHEGIFIPTIGKNYGIGIFIKKTIKILEKGAINIHKDSNLPSEFAVSTRKLQWIKCKINKKIFYILNVHGLWDHNGKLDTHNKMLQSQKIRDFVKTLNYPIILCGDFNLHPNTKSLQIIENYLLNLNKMYDVTSTRTSLYTKSNKVVDYIFISPGIEIDTFKILSEEVSDHSPLFLKVALST